MKYYSTRETQQRFPRILKEAPFVITNRGMDQCLVLPIENEIAQEYVKTNTIEAGVTNESLARERREGFASGNTETTVFTDSPEA